MHRYLKMAMEYAKSHEYDQNMDYSLCAIIVRGGSIKSIGFNKQDVNSFVGHCELMARQNYHDSHRCHHHHKNYNIQTHAELDAISRSRGKIDLRGSKVYVVRLRRTGDYGMARPCSICENALYRYGIKQAFYSIDDTHYGQMKIKGQGITKDKIYRDEISNKENKERCSR